MKKTLPLFYFKPTICWVDDDRLFLDAASASFSQYFTCNTFNNPAEALRFFDSYQAPLENINFKREFTESDVFGTSNHFPVDIDIPSITKLSNNNEIKNEVAVLIVDYHMAEMNGMELCQQLKNFNGKKILLTGEATHEKAVEAFNLGLIDRFVRKGYNIADTLQDCVAELVYEYFEEKTANLVEHLEASRPSLLSDPHFIDFFNSWRSGNQFEEYYLLNSQGAFLVKDKNDNWRYLIMHSEQDTREFVKLNDEFGGEAAELVAKVGRGEVVPFFGERKEAWEVDASDWSGYFYPAQVLQGREKYYWAVVDKK